MKIKKGIILEINAEFGSDFQQESALEALQAMLTAWKQFYLTTNEQNRIEIKYDEARREVNKSG